MKIKTDRLFAILAFVVSVSTLYVFFYQTSLMKKQQYTSVLPFLSLGNTQVNENYSFVLTNNGIGPAFIEKINIHYQDTIFYNSDINEFFNKVIKQEDTIFNSMGITHSTLRKGMLIPEKETRYMLTLNHEVDDFKNKQIRLREWLNNQIKVEIEYSSIYKEKWRIIYPNPDNDAPIKIK